MGRAAVAVEMVEMVEMAERPAAGRAAEIAEETATASKVGSADVEEGVGGVRAGEEDDVALLDVGLSDSDSEGVRERERERERDRVPSI
jgi:hypothetical protein